MHRSARQLGDRACGRGIELATVLLVIGLTGCAGLPSKQGLQSANGEDQPLKFETRASLPLLSNEEADLFQGLVRAGTGDERLTYSARYALEPGKLLVIQSEGEGTDQSGPRDIGRQTVHQQLQLNLSDDDRIPLQLGLENRRDIRFLVDGEQFAQATRAHLDYNPQPIAVRLDWRLPEELAAAPLGCHFNGSLRVPLATAMIGMPSAMDFSHSECFVRAPQHGLEESVMRSREIAWRWGSDLKSALRVRQVRPFDESRLMNPAGPAHEVGLSHREEFGGWRMQLDIAGRESNLQDSAGGKHAATHWVADVLLNGKLGWLDVSARFMRAGDPLWFMPISTPADSRRVSLLFDFGAWLKEELPGVEADMSASFERAEQTNGIDDNQVNWNVSLTW